MNQQGYQPDKNSALDAFWDLRAEIINNHLKELGIDARLSLKTPEERALFISTLKEINEEDELEKRKL